MELYEAMRSSGTTRRFKPDPVPPEVVQRVLENARFAPNGGNRQGWRVILVTDPERRRRLRDLYQSPWADYLKVRGTPAPAVQDFAENFHRAPLHLVVLVELRALAVTDRALPRQSIVGGGSIYPFVHNILLGLRAEGLGAALTTVGIAAEPEVFRELGVPDEGWAMAALIVVGYPEGKLPTKLRRKDVAEFATRETFDGEPFSP